MFDLAADIWEVAKELTALQISWENERADISWEWELWLAEMRVGYLEKQEEIQKRLNVLNSKGVNTSKPIGYSETELEAKWDEKIDGVSAKLLLEVLRLKKEQADIDNELNIINANTTAVVREQAEAYSNLTASQKLMEETKEKIKKQQEEEKKKMEELKLKQAELSEKMKIADAVAKWRNITTKLVWDTLTAQYENEKGEIVDITNFKNMTYANDLALQLQKWETETIKYQEKVDAEFKAFDTLNTNKAESERIWGEAMVEEKKKQEAALINERRRTLSAAAAWKRYWAAKKNKGYSEWWYTGDAKGYADWGYTWPWGKNAVAGLVHKWEYVIPQKVMKKIGSTWLLWMLEKMRTGFADGGFTSKIADFAQNTVNKTNSVNVIQNISDGVDFESWTNEMLWMLNARA